MKKFLLSTMIGTTLMSTITGGSLAFAEVQLTEGAKNQNVQVSYVAVPEIATSKYMVSIPSTIEFTSVNKGVDLKVELFDAAGKTYTDGSGVDITISSENSFKLKSSNAELAYTLTYDDVVFSSGASTKKIHLGTAKTSTQGTARINAVSSITPGNYVDTLTYTVTANE